MKISQHRAASRVMALALILLLVLPSVSTKPAAQPRTDTGTAAAPSSGGPLRSMTEANRLPAVLDALEKISAGASRAAFDVAARAEELGKDVDRIFAFVRDDVRYEVYQGVLRGPRGTLMARAGNSFDKALLLGALLRHHGVDVRYVRGRLSPDRAAALVSAMFQPSKATDGGPVGDLTAVPGATEAAKELGGVIAERWGKSLDTVIGALERRRIRLASSPPVTPDQLAQEASGHVWVEYKRDSKWVALDPSFKEARAGAIFGAGGQVHPSIPPSDYHQVTIRVVLEERRSAGLSRREVLRHRRPAADLHGAAVALRFKGEPAGVGWSAAPVLHVDTDSIKGQVIASSGTGASGQALGGRVSGALRGAAPQASSEVVALWLEVDFLTPGGKPETVRRALFDRVGPAAREAARERTSPLAPLPEAKGVPLYLGSLYGLSFVSGTLDARYALHRVSGHLAVLRQNLPVVAAAERGDRQMVEREARRLAPTMEPLLPQVVAQAAMAFHLYSHRGFQLARQGRARADVWLYEASPRLAIASYEPRLAGDGKTLVGVALDLRRNDVRVVGRDLASAQIISANVLRGILDAALEHVIISTLMPSANGVATTSSTLAIIEQAMADRIDVDALTRRDEVTVLRVSEDVKARMQRSLGEGAVLIAPGRMVRFGGVERLAWWRVDLRSGEVLAIMDSGLHQTASEMFGVMVVSAISAVLYLVVYGGPLFLATDGAIKNAFDAGYVRARQEMRGDCAWVGAYCEPTCGPLSPSRRPCGIGEQLPGPPWGGHPRE